MPNKPNRPSQTPMSEHFLASIKVCSVELHILLVAGASDSCMVTFLPFTDFISSFDSIALVLHTRIHTLLVQ